MPTITLKLTPLDVLFFRDARPFGLADHGESSLPTPQSFAGLIKTHLMPLAKLSPAKLHGLADRNQAREQWPWFAQLRFRGPWLHVEDREALSRHLSEQDDSPPQECPPVGPLVALPSDLVQIGKTGSNLVRLRPLVGDDLLPGWKSPIKGLDMKPLWHRGREDLRPATGKLLDRDGLEQYLRCTGDHEQAGVPTAEHVHELRHLLAWESRTGIGVNPDSLTAADGQIYSARFLRLRPGVCFVGEVDVPDTAPPLTTLFPQPLALPWGGEGRRVLIECETGGIEWPRLTAEEVGENLLTVLLTPGIYHSRDLDRRPLWKPSDNGGLIAASVGKPLAISGWDMAGNAATRERDRESRSDSLDDTVALGRPRPTRFAAPAGSVYFWHRSHTKAANAPEPFPPHCDKPQDHDTGWGVALCGRWKECDLS